MRGNNCDYFLLLNFAIEIKLHLLHFYILHSHNVRNVLLSIEEILRRPDQQYIVHICIHTAARNKSIIFNDQINQ